MHTRILTVTAFTFLAAVSATPVAHAFDLTGHWAGKWTCRGFDGTKFTDVNKTSTLAITQVGNALTAEEDGEATLAGVAIPDASKPDKGEAVLIACNTNTVFLLNDGNSEIVRVSVKTKTGTFKATLKGLSVLENNLPLFGQEIQTCKYSYKRVDTNDPMLIGCPV